MVLNNLFDLNPLFECSLPYLSFALVTEVFDFCLLRLAVTAEFLELDVDLKIFRNLLAFIFADVFRTQL